MFSTSPLGFGATQDIASQQQSPEKRQRQEDKQTCMPATCRLVLDAVGKGEDKDLYLHGQEVANVVLVGVVEELSMGAVVEFTLNDGSGRLKVRHYQTSEKGEGIESIVAGRYVSVVGMPRQSPALHISAMSMRPVTSADEVSYHTIEVAHVALTLKRGGSRATQPVLVPQAAAHTQPQQVTQTSALASEILPAVVGGGVTNLKESVIAILRREGETRVEGVPLALVCEQIKGSNESEVKAVLEDLVNEGEAFNTIDDTHFTLL